MLRKNNFIVILSVLLCAIGFSSCCNEPASPSAFYAVEILPKEGESVQSDIIKVADNMTLNDESWIFLYNVSCSLRNDENKEEILATNVTDTWYPEATFCFTVKNSKTNTAKNTIYFDDEAKFEEECYARENDTSKYFIIINDPDLAGYDSNYETVKQYCYESLANTPIYLGANKTE